jgi:hypothetical protein
MAVSASAGAATLGSFAKSDALDGSRPSSTVSVARANDLGPLALMSSSVSLPDILPEGPCVDVDEELLLKVTTTSGRESSVLT